MPAESTPHTPQSPQGDTHGSPGSPLFVLNNDTEALNVPSAGDVGDPYRILNEAANHANVRLVNVNSRFFTHLHIYHAWRNLAPATQSPRVQVFGRLPVWGGQESFREYPHDVDAAFPEMVDGDTGDGIWVPLINTSESNIYLDLGTADSMRNALTTGRRMQLGKRFQVPLLGVTRVMCLITRVATYGSVSSSSSGQDTSEGLVIGHFGIDE